MLVWCVLGLLLLHTALNFGGFDVGTTAQYTLLRGGLGRSAEIGDAGEEVREASGCDVDCTEMCWYLADGRCLSSK